MKKPQSYAPFVALLRKGLILTYDDIVEKCGISRRQAHTWVKTVKSDQLPLIEERRGRKLHFRFAEKDWQDSLQITLTHEQWQALLITSEAMQALLIHTPIVKPLQEVLLTLIEEGEANQLSLYDLEEGKTHWYFKTQHTQNIPSHLFNSLIEALWKQKTVSFDYFSAYSMQYSKERTLDPYCLALINGSWMLTGYCHRHKALRDFSVLGISNLALVDKDNEYTSFDRMDFNPQEYYQIRFNALSDSGKTHQVKLHVEATRVPYFERKTYHSSQEIEERFVDGSALISFETDSLNDIRAFVQSFGTGVKVVSPPELIEMIVNEAKQILKKYL